MTAAVLDGPGRIKPRLSPVRATRYGVLDNSLSVAIATLSVLLLVLAGLTGFAIVSGQTEAFIGTAAGAGCLDLGLLLLL